MYIKCIDLKECVVIHMNNAFEQKRTLYDLLQTLFKVIPFKKEVCFKLLEQHYCSIDSMICDGM